jgi:omega-6 fatty acid desaturase (delta-12 desaturase)
MTVQEYFESSRWQRFAYVLARNPVILFCVAPLVLFLFLERWPRKGAKSHEVRSVHLTTLAILAMGFGMSMIFGFVNYLIVQLVVMAIAGGSGVWLFYLQHQFEDAYWTRSEDWDYELAALKGSAFFRLPRVLQWFSGNIGFHHIHHLSPRIPNYNLERCQNSDPLFSEVQTMTLWSSFKSLQLRLWDEASQKLVTFRQARMLRVPVRVQSR